MRDEMFRTLDAEETARFQPWARENDPPSNATWSLYHPVCRTVWYARGLRPDDDKARTDNAL